MLKRVLVWDPHRKTNYYLSYRDDYSLSDTLITYVLDSWRRYIKPTPTLKYAIIRENTKKTIGVKSPQELLIVLNHLKILGKTEQEIFEYIDGVFKLID